MSAATREGKRAAMKWVQALRAGGGTEMHSAVLEALAASRGRDHRPQPPVGLAHGSPAGLSSSGAAIW